MDRNSSENIDEGFDFIEKGGVLNCGLEAWLKNKTEQIILFGAGKIGRETLTILRGNGIYPICFADDTYSKQGSIEQGTPIVSLDQALMLVSASPVVLCCLFTPGHQFKKTADRIRSISKNAIVIPFFTIWHYFQSKNFEFYFLSDPVNELERLPVYRDLYGKLNDDCSRRTLISHFRLRVFHDTSLDLVSHDNIPIPIGLLNDPNLGYLDGGAFDGDTVEKFIECRKAFSHIWAVEPDNENCKRMMLRLSRLDQVLLERISVLSKGLWIGSGYIGFNSMGNMGSSIDPALNEKISVISIDEILENVMHPVLIKLDLEGAEMAALAGSIRVTKRLRPIWAISVYHKPSDLVDVFNWLQNCGQEYNYGLRCHGGDGSDLLLYAW